MIGQIIGAVGSLASTYIEGKVTTQKVNAEIKKKQLTGEIDWDLEAIKATQSSLKDEWVVFLISIPFLMCFISDTTREMAFKGFDAISRAPTWYTYSFGVVIASSLGIRSATKFFGGKK